MIIKKTPKDESTTIDSTEVFEYYKLVLDGLIVKVEDGSITLDDKENIELCDLQFDGETIVNNSEFVDMVEDNMQSYADSYADGKYILSGNVVVYVNPIDIDSFDLLNIVLVSTNTI